MNSLIGVAFCLTLSLGGCLASKPLIPPKEPKVPCLKLLLGCPPGYIQVEKGEDKNGCPTHECRRKPCPPVRKCPPFSHAAVNWDKNGCPTSECRRCPPVRKCPPFSHAAIDRDENGCAVMKCMRLPCPMIMCPPGMVKKLVAQKVPGRCPIFRCDRLPCPPIPRCPPNSKVDFRIDPTGCPVIKCYFVPCPLVRCKPGTIKVERRIGGLCPLYDCIEEPHGDNFNFGKGDKKIKEDKKKSKDGKKKDKDSKEKSKDSKKENSKDIKKEKKQ